LALHLATYVEPGQAASICDDRGHGAPHNVLANAARFAPARHVSQRVQQVGRILAAWVMVFTLMAVGIFLFKASDLLLPRLVVSWYASGAILPRCLPTVLARSGPAVTLRPG